MNDGNEFAASQEVAGAVIAASEYFSALTCACGCDTLLPQKIVKLGRRYLHGHKGFGVNGDLATRAREQAARTREKTKPGPVIELGRDSMMKTLDFLICEERQLLAQGRRHKGEIERSCDALILVLERLETLSPVIDNLRGYMGATGGVPKS